MFQLIRQAILAALVLAGLSACAQQPITLESVGEARALGGAKRVVEVDNIWVASQPDLEALELARTAGVSTIINLRQDSEMDWDEAEAVADLGMTYHAVPVSGRAGRLVPEDMERIHAIVKAAGTKPIMVHCASGNRVGAWLATYLMDVQGATSADALAVGKAAGIRSEAVEDWVREYRR